MYEFLSSDRMIALFLAGMLVFGAGCSGLLGDDGGSSDTDTLEIVPEGSNMVMEFDSGVIRDEATVTLMNGLAEMSGEDQTYEEMLEEAESESNLSIDSFNSALMFGKVEDFDDQNIEDSGQEYVGIIMDTEWTYEELQQASDDGMSDDLEEDTYNGVTVYKTTDEMGEETWLADLGDGLFVAGIPEATQDAIDTYQGDKNSFSGDVRDAYENAEDGYMKAAMVLPESAEEAAGGGGMNMPTPNILTMTYHTDGTTMNVDTNMKMASEEDANNLNGTLNLFLGSMGQGSQDDPTTKLLEALSIQQEGDTVRVSISMTAEELLQLIEESGGMMGPGMGQDPFSVSSTGSSGIAG